MHAKPIANIYMHVCLHACRRTMCHDMLRCMMSHHAFLGAAAGIFGVQAGEPATMHARRPSICK